MLCCGVGEIALHERESGFVIVLDFLLVLDFLFLFCKFVKVFCLCFVSLVSVKCVGCILQCLCVCVCVCMCMFVFMCVCGGVLV